MRLKAPAIGLDESHRGRVYLRQNLFHLIRVTIKGFVLQWIAAVENWKGRSSTGWLEKVLQRVRRLDKFILTFYRNQNIFYSKMHLLKNEKYKLFIFKKTRRE